MIRTAPLILILVMLGCSSSKAPWTSASLKNVDIERYMGTWYEIARFPHRFEKDLVGVTATYTLRNDGKVDVLNRGFKNTLDGDEKSTKAFAKVPNPKEPGRLKVYFFWPFGADYLILHLNQEDYQWALVGSSSPNYLWVLSRTPQMDYETYQMIVGKAKSLGFDTQRIELVEQRQ